MELPTLQPPVRQRASATRSPHLFDTVWHLIRVALLCALIVGLHRMSARRAGERMTPVDDARLLSEVRRYLPQSAALRSLGESELLEIIDDADAGIGAVAKTSPAADSVVGYSGPNNVMLVLSSDQKIIACSLLSSGDTRDHVDLVQRNSLFWEQFLGRPWGSISSEQLFKVDGVSGATLTSLAIAEAITLRMSGQRLSLRFPQPLTLTEAQALVPETVELGTIIWHGQTAWQPLNSTGQALGTIVRTGSLVDAIEGYQGPTELLMWFDSSDVLRNVKLRGSFDNQPYVGYVQQEYSFWPLFKNRSLQSLAEIDLQAEKIEGVSGATMTSMAVAQTIQTAAERMLIEPPVMPVKSALSRSHSNWNWSMTELATTGLALASIPWSRWRMRGRRWPRLTWQIACLLVIGISAGNLLSLALFAGWTRGGVPLHLAPGLVSLLAVALVWPAVSKSNVYCDHLCPHGIVQQWMLPWQRSWRRRNGTRDQITDVTSSHIGSSLSRWGARVLRSLSYAGIVAAVGWIVFDWPIPLAWLEPFDAYAWRIGWSLSCVVWLASLLIAMRRPMAYCQLACPTGRLLDIIRRARRGRWSWLVEFVLFVAVASVWGF